MAPRKEKSEKVSADEAATTILNYLRKQNRPYSATDISANLHNKVTKAAAVKILKDLHEKNEIEGRAAGKQLVYHAVQEPIDSLTPQSLSALDSTIQDLRTKTTFLNTTAKTLRSTLSTLNTSLPTSELLLSISSLEKEKCEIEDRLAALKAGKAKKVTKKEREGMEAEWKKWQAVSKRRERIGKDMWSLIEDVVQDGNVRAEIRESLGLDE
ncbi:Tat binding protein 1-interacting [Amniculicola lignicola CBS 123094]|uniref:Tat binding protein 1-interacting n=1 Tax=Amniculicola lignicola CBS 123094 TaxID=1392246 RepID=A0A6A5WH02_9PLEO|nr:Tat binding protein 1-interacting [Amniculicola lignicola CBS 123094]